MVAVVDTAVETESFKTLIASTQACKKGGNFERQRTIHRFCSERWNEMVRQKRL
jgi:hypothetical protein